MNSSGWSFSWLVARRFLGGDKSRLLAGTARAAIFSIATGVMAMVVGMALMSGYRHDLEQRLLAGSAAVGVFPSGVSGAIPPEKALETLRGIAGVESVGRVVYGQGSVSTESDPDGVDVTLRGIDPGGTDLGGVAIDLTRDAGSLPGIALGSALARRLGVAQGDTVRLTVLEVSSIRPRFRYRSAVVVDPFSSGYFEFDRSWAVVEREVLEELTGLAGTMELTLAQAADAGWVANEARELLGVEYEVRNFRNANRELFEALEWQQLLLFLVLGLIVVVSTFNIASTLMVLVRERLRQLGVLSAMGARPRHLATVFVIYGALVGALGVLAGLSVGGVAAWLLDEFQVIQLGSGLSSIYFLSSVPFRVDLTDLAAIGLFSLGVTFLACLLPARRALQLDPSRALRYQ